MGAGHIIGWLPVEAHRYVNYAEAASKGENLRGVADRHRHAIWLANLVFSLIAPLKPNDAGNPVTWIPTDAHTARRWIER
jgi:hypothetical protein